MIRYLQLLTSIIAFVSPLPGQQDLRLTIEPEVGSPDQIFTVTITNIGPEDFRFDGCCSLPVISALPDGDPVPICEVCGPCGPIPNLNDLLRPAESLTHQWDPRCYRDLPPSPGIYEVRWAGFPDTVVGRLELLPDPGRALRVSADPPVARMGDEVKIQIINDSPSALINAVCSCTYSPTILDPLGFQALCTSCPNCLVPVELLPGATASFDWTPGVETCKREVLPGRYRIIWGGYDGKGNPYYGETTVLVLPPAERYLELTVSTDVVQAGETLRITATNPLDVPVWHAACCDSPYFIDSLGQISPCEPCLLDCIPIRSHEIAPGESISMEVPVAVPLGCGRRPGISTVLWGPNFALVPGLEPAPPVYGLAEILILPHEPFFLRGDCNADGDIDLNDAIHNLFFQFMGASMNCVDSADMDDDGKIEVADIIYLLTHLFLGGSSPKSPFPRCGPDVVEDDFPLCEYPVDGCW